MPKYHTQESYSFIGDIAREGGVISIRCDLHCQFWVGTKAKGYMAYRYVYEKLMPSKATDGFLDIVSQHDQSMKINSPLTQSRVIWVDNQGRIKEVWKPGMDYDSRIRYDRQSRREQQMARYELAQWMRGEIHDEDRGLPWPR